MNETSFIYRSVYAIDNTEDYRARVAIYVCIELLKGEKINEELSRTTRKPTFGSVRRSYNNWEDSAR